MRDKKTVSFSSKQVTALALFLSLLFHAGLYFWLRGSYKVANFVSAKKGVVSVEFVQSVSHEPVLPKSKGPDKKPAQEQKTQPEKAQNLAGQKGVEGDPQAVARETDVFITKITDLIASHKIYPQEAIDREEEGKVILGITVERDGHISGVQIEQASPFELLNQAALRSVHRIESFPPVPELVPVPLHLHVPLVFRIETR